MKIGDVLGVGIDVNVFIVIFGEYGDSGELVLKNFEIYKDKFERNYIDVFSFKNFLSLGECKVKWLVERSFVFYGLK